MKNPVAASLSFIYFPHLPWHSAKKGNKRKTLISVKTCLEGDCDLVNSIRYEIRVLSKEVKL